MGQPIVVTHIHALKSGQFVILLYTHTIDFSHATKIYACTATDFAVLIDISLTKIEKSCPQNVANGIEGRTHVFVNFITLKYINWF